MTLLTTNSKTLDEKVAAINSRLDRGDGADKGGLDMRTGILATIIVAMSIAGVVVNWSHSAATPAYAPPAYTPPPYAPQYYPQQPAPPAQVSVVPVVPVPVPH